MRLPSSVSSDFSAPAAEPGSDSDSALHTSDRNSIVIVGREGRMGSLLGRAWENAGFAVSGLARDDYRQDAAILAGADIVVPAVPVDALCAVVERLAPHLRPDQLLLDITSVKVLPLLIMQELHSGPVIGSHPLFGPASFQGALHTVLVAGHYATPAMRRRAEGLFTAIGSSVAWTSAQEHDHGVAFAQSLNFALGSAFVSTIARHPECLPFLTPSFRRHMEALRLSLTEDKDMFCALSSRNPSFPAAVEAYSAAFREVTGNLPGLAAEAAAWFASKAPVKTA